MHAGNGSTEHGLHRIADQRALHGDYEFDVIHVFFQPALNTAAQFVHMLEHDRALGLVIESQNRVSAELPHYSA